MANSMCRGPGRFEQPLFEVAGNAWLCPQFSRVAAFWSDPTQVKKGKKRLSVVENFRHVLAPLLVSEMWVGCIVYPICKLFNSDPSALSIRYEGCSAWADASVVRSHHAKRYMHASFRAGA